MPNISQGSVETRLTCRYLTNFQSQAAIFDFNYRPYCRPSNAVGLLWVWFRTNRTDIFHRGLSKSSSLGRSYVSSARSLEENVPFSDKSE